MSMQPSQQRGRSWWRPVRALAALVTVTLVAALVSPAGAADRRPPVLLDAAKAAVSGISVAASTTTTSSKGVKLSASLEASRIFHTDVFTFSLALPDGAERHSWSFPARAGGFDVNGDGKGKLTMASSAARGFAKIKVIVTPTSKFKTHKCNGKVASKSRNVRVKGVYFSDSKSDSWGHVGSKTKQSFVLKGTYTESYKVSCPNNPSCQTAVGWSISRGSMNRDETVFGYSSGEESYASGYRRSLIPGSNGVRYDFVRGPDPTKPVLNVMPDDNATMDVWAGAGSAVLTSKNPYNTFKEVCGKDQKQVRDYWYGTVSNGNQPLKLTMQAAAPLVVSNTSTAYFYQQHPKG